MKSVEQPSYCFKGRYTEAWLWLIFAYVLLLTPALFLAITVGLVDLPSNEHTPSTAENIAATIIVAIVASVAFYLVRRIAKRAGTTIRIAHGNIEIEEWRSIRKVFSLNHSMRVDGRKLIICPAEDEKAPSQIHQYTVSLEAFSESDLSELRDLVSDHTHTC